MHLAGVVFRSEADRLLGGRTFYRSESTSDDPAESEVSVHAGADLT